MAILTPDVGKIDLDYIFFMIGHGMIIVAVMYATVAEQSTICKRYFKGFRNNYLYFATSDLCD